MIRAGSKVRRIAALGPPTRLRGVVRGRQAVPIVHGCVVVVAILRRTDREAYACLKIPKRLRDIYCDIRCCT